MIIIIIYNILYHIIMGSKVLLQSAFKVQFQTFNGALAPPSNLDRIKSVRLMASSMYLDTVTKSSSINPRVVNAKHSSSLRFNAFWRREMETSFTWCAESQSTRAQGGNVSRTGVFVACNVNGFEHFFRSVSV